MAESRISIEEVEVFLIETVIFYLRIFLNCYSVERHFEQRATISNKIKAAGVDENIFFFAN